MATMTQKAQAVPPMRIEQVPIGSLTPHPRNYRSHPERQLTELQTSLREYGWARNVVVSSDNVILAGHGIVEAARKEGHTTVPVFRLGLKGSDPRAEKFLVLENTVSRLAEDDDTQLAALLADVQRTEGLAGTGYGDADLDALIAELAAEGAGAGQVERQTLAEQWGAPPFSVLDARQGYWQERKRQWLSLGIRSELGRGGGTGHDAVARANSDAELGRDAELSPAAQQQTRRGGAAAQRNDWRKRATP